MKLYERCAEDIANLILNGILRPGEKLASATRASRAASVAPLSSRPIETIGLIEARARSGYYWRSGRLPVTFPGRAIRSRLAW